MKHFGKEIDFAKELSNTENNYTIKNVKFNKPATIIFWEDGTKTVSVCKVGDIYDKEKGFLIAALKKYIGSETSVLLNEWCCEQPKKTETAKTSPNKKNNKINDNTSRYIKMSLNEAEMLCTLLYALLK